MHKLKVGIVGAGNIASTAHLPSYMKMDNVEVVGICDKNLEVANKVAVDFNIKGVYDDYLKMIKELKPDIVNVCVGNRFHYSITMDALNNGCHVFCEKPPAMNGAEAKEMYEASVRNKKILQYNFHHRFSTEFKNALNIIKKGELGNIYSVKVIATRRRGIPGWGNFIDKNAQGGGPLIDIGIHMLDLALKALDYPEINYLTNSCYTKIGNVGGTGLFGSWDTTKFTVEDSSFGFIKLENGTTITVETSFALNMKEKDELNVILYGDRAGLSLYPLEIYGDSYEGLVNKNYPFLVQSDRYFESLNSFVQKVIHEDFSENTALEGYKIQKLIENMYISSDENRPIVYDLGDK